MQPRLHEILVKKQRAETQDFHAQTGSRKMKAFAAPEMVFVNKLSPRGFRGVCSHPDSDPSFELSGNFTSILSRDFLLGGAFVFTSSHDSKNGSERLDCCRTLF